MSRKDLERIARELRDVRPDARAYSYTGWLVAVEAVADACHDTMGLSVNGNRRFNRERFLTAAGAI